MFNPVFLKLKAKDITAAKMYFQCKHLFSLMIGQNDSRSNHKMRK